MEKKNKDRDAYQYNYFSKFNFLCKNNIYQFYIKISNNSNNKKYKDLNIQHNREYLKKLSY